MGGAGLLILAGLVFQLGTLGHVPPGNVWIVSTIVESIWSMLIPQLDAQEVQELTTFWPLLLISMGLAILFVTRREGDQRLLSPSRGGQSHDI
jgi:hypothetical protein